MKLNTPEPNLIFKDMRVPKKKGLEVEKIIKKDRRLKKVLTLMLTSSYSSCVPHALNGAFANICPEPVQEAVLELKWVSQNKDLEQTPQLYKVSKNEFNWLMEYFKSLISEGR